MRRRSWLQRAGGGSAAGVLSSQGRTVCRGGEEASGLSREFLGEQKEKDFLLEGELFSSCLSFEETFGSSCANDSGFVISLQIASFKCCVVWSTQAGTECVLLIF